MHRQIDVFMKHGTYILAIHPNQSVLFFLLSDWPVLPSFRRNVVCDWLTRCVQGAGGNRHGGASHGVGVNVEQVLPLNLII